jgi:hypothetical protein
MGVDTPQLLVYVVRALGQSAAYRKSSARIRNVPAYPFG